MYQHLIIVQHAKRMINMKPDRYKKVAPGNQLRIQVPVKTSRAGPSLIT